MSFPKIIRLAALTFVGDHIGLKAVAFSILYKSLALN